MMRDAARAVGRLLADEHDFAGAFTIDGIVGADGWLPTELNPRYGGGLEYTSSVTPTSRSCVHQMPRLAGDAPDVRAADIEALLIPAADETRWGGGWSMIHGFDVTETETLPVRFVDGDDMQVAQTPTSPTDGRDRPDAVGGFVRLAAPDRTPKGPSIAHG